MRHELEDRTARLVVVPVSRDEARAFVATHHRHNRAFVGWKFGAGLADESGQLVGVAAAGRPCRALDDGRTIELVRVTTLGDRNACSMLYGALCRAAKALGFQVAVTYTLESEPGTSLRAAGFEPVAYVPTREHGGGRARYQENLFGEAQRPVEAKWRWQRILTPNPRPSSPARQDLTPEPDPNHPRNREPKRNSLEAAGVDGLTALAEEDAPSS